jgi:hypothetical protein
MDKCLRKAAVGELRRASTMQAFRLTPGFGLVGTFEFFENQARGPSAEIPCKRFNWRLVTKAAFYLQRARLINLQRHGKDPDALWLSYIPVLDLFRKMYSDIRNKEGFVLKPRVKV